MQRVPDDWNLSLICPVLKIKIDTYLHFVDYKDAFDSLRRNRQYAAMNLVFLQI